MDKLAKCDTCGYNGNIGVWKGEYTLDGKKEKFKGKVRYGDDGFWDLTKILPKEDVDEFDGMCYCPFCDSISFD